MAEKDKMSFDIDLIQQIREVAKNILDTEYSEYEILYYTFYKDNALVFLKKKNKPLNAITDVNTLKTVLSVHSFDLSVIPKYEKIPLQDQELLCRYLLPGTPFIRRGLSKRDYEEMISIVSRRFGPIIKEYTELVVGE